MSLTRFADDDDVHREEEEIPFLETEDILRRPTPLPKFQFSVLLTLWVAEAIVDNSIGPYLNQVRAIVARPFSRTRLSVC
jgi:hypothetical protein